MSAPLRLSELDGVRGVAAAVVVLAHLGASTRLPYVLPLESLVVIFFVLSGLVLSLSLERRGESGTTAFAIRRIGRIYVPYVVSIALAAAIASWIDPWSADRSGLSPWAADQWPTAPTAGSFLGHLTLVGWFPNGQLNPVTWTLVHEMRLSLVFPVLWLAMARTTTARALTAAAALSLAGYGLGEVAQHTGWALTDLDDTLRIAPMFMVGCLLAAHRVPLVEGYRRLPGRARMAASSVGLALFLYPVIAPGTRILHLGTIDEWVGTAGAAAVLLTVMGSERSGALMRCGVAAFLGRIAYSLYLYHVIVLLALLFTLRGRVPLPVILAATVPISIGLAWAGLLVVERPANRWARRLSQRFARSGLSPLPATAERPPTLAG